MRSHLLDPCSFIRVQTWNSPATPAQKVEIALGLRDRKRQAPSPAAEPIQGPEVRSLLLKGCALDLHPSQFPPGRCARTRFAALPTILRCTSATNFECIVTSSYRDYLLSWLADAAEEFLG